ncbi:hypothetical protein [Euzebyella saccharophila]|uniref:Uncharacterized protein n=1 Tax=Euzebyella saccharophila TaxID=679664 RepID=A0ABV8JM53_9FLAO|nr:hypothetical protein [Euzebyella saccharophila]
MNKITFYILISFLLHSCANHGQLKFLAKLPKDLKENSGIAYFSGDTAWFVADSGNSDDIYQVNFEGKLVKKLEVKNAKNRDWEELTEDKKGNLYIGNFGNNYNDRDDLVIYKLPNPEIEPGKKIDAQKIEFRFPEQKDFPPKKKDLIYDAEAMFHYKGFLYIFTKDRANPFTGRTALYKVPDTEGNYDAKLISSLNICDNWDFCRITAADISNDGTTVVLLGYGKLWKFTDFSGDDFLSGKIKEYELGLRTQLESVTFLNDRELLLSDEENKKGGGNLYSFSID